MHVILTTGKKEGWDIRYIIILRLLYSHGLIRHLMCVYTAFLYSKLSAFPHILSLDECCIGVYQPLNLTPALYFGIQGGSGC